MDLAVWLSGELVAHVRERRKKFFVEYTDETRVQYGPEIPLLSCSLPTPGPGRTDHTRSFLEGLLPEGSALQAMAAQVRGVRLTPGGVPFEPSDSVLLLGEFGRECAGAIALAPTGSGWSPGPGRYVPVDEEGLDRLIANLPSAPLGVAPQEGRRMSLAGAQPKLVLARFDNQWYEPSDGAASTHILKPTGSWPLSSDNEAAVMWMARTVGLSASASWVEQVGVHRVYVVKRYDRVVAAHEAVSRRHQEDVCQALGIRPVDKYNLGRPSARIARVLRTWSQDLETDLTRLLQQLTFRAIIGDEDGHGKNISVMLDDGRVSLAPLYDSLCTMAYGQLDGKMATPIGTQVSLFKVDRQSLVEEGRSLGMPEATARSVVADVAERLRDVVDGVWELDLEEQAAASVVAITAERAANLLAGKPMGAAPQGSALDLAGRRQPRRARRLPPG